jgi:hypothetical protein
MEAAQKRETIPNGQDLRHVKKPCMELLGATPRRRRKAVALKKYLS